MNRAERIVAAASALVVAGLVALAAPAFISIGEAALTTASAVDRLTATSAPVVEPMILPEPTTEPIRDRTHGDCALLYYPDGGISPALDAPTDTGVRQFAEGTVELVDGLPTLYTVAAGDAIAAIGTRFCTFSTGIFYFNDVHLQGAIQPGDVLRLR